jgi:GT2 family glycosyltransferase
MVYPEKYFAVFVMTFQRNLILEQTILQLFDQSYPPQKVLVIDNDPLQLAQEIAEKLSHLPVAYYAIGYNSGPAGAAKKGLELLSDEGYKWIGWIDDDDPPLFKDTFEILINRAASVNNCGCVGSVGQYFDFKKAVITRVPDQELEHDGIIMVDNIAGNMCKIVNAKIVREKNITPDEELFFGFEELDFDIQLKKAGFLLVVDKQLYKKHRQYYKREHLKTKRGYKKDINLLWRDYYSTRNILYILKKNKLYKGFALSLLRILIKMFMGFKYGFKYGMINFNYNFLGLCHFATGKKGKYDKCHLA